MNSDQIFDLIEEIAATSSKNAKIDLLKEGCKHKEFRDVLQAAYNPLITYGIDDVPDRRESEFGGSDTDNHFDARTSLILDQLAARTLTGNAARDAIVAEMDTLTEGSAELFKRILKKDLRAGFSASSCNKACKGLIPEFPYMRCSLPKDAKFEEWPWEAGVISQEKADGMFVNINHYEDGSVSVLSRQGSPFPECRLEALRFEIRRRLPAGTQTHGELLVMKNGSVLPREVGNGILNSLLSGGEHAPDETVFCKVWDNIPLSAVNDAKTRYTVPYRTRVRSLITALRDNPGVLLSVIETKLVRSLAEAYIHAGSLMKQGKEGTIVKHPDAAWRDGTSKEQVKLKLEFTVDLEVVAIEPGEKDTKNEGRAGALRCKSSCGGLEVSVTVKNEAMRDHVDESPDEWIGSIIEVLANDIMMPSESNPLHSLFLPRMTVADYRRDKSEADDLERIFASKEAAILGTGLFKKAA